MPAQTVFDEWCKMPWFRGVVPELTKTVAKHCTTLAAYDPLPTAKDMLKTRQWYQRQYPDRKGWYLGNFVTAYPQYLSDQYQPDQERSDESQAAIAPNEDTLVYWNPEGNRKCLNSMIWDWMPYAEAVKHGYTPERKLTDAEVKNHENRKALRRETEKLKAQRLAATV
jgi:hypothetical protein